MQVRSLRDIRKLKLRLGNTVQITKCGGMFKARYAGHSNFCFGQTPSEARERLSTTKPTIVKNNKRNAEVCKRNRSMGFRKVGGKAA